MDANGSRYHALVSERNWTGCLPAAASDRQLEWRNGALMLKALLFEFKPGFGKNDAVAEQSGRGGSFDAYGNLYSIASDRRSLRIRSAGSGAMSDFWPVSGAAAGGAAHDGVAAIEGYRGGERTTSGGSFQATGSSTPGLPALDAMTVSTGHYLVVASQEAGGLLIFDLYGAGPPLFQGWPALATDSAEALVALDDGGVGALRNNRLLRTGPDLKPRIPLDQHRPAFAPKPAAVADAAPSATTAALSAAGEPCELDLGPALPSTLGAQASAVAVLPGGRLLVLSRDPDQPGIVWLGAIGLDGKPLPVVPGKPAIAGASLQAAASSATTVLALNPLIGAIAIDQVNPSLAARALAIDWGKNVPAASDARRDAPFSVIVVAAGGDQAYRFAAQWQDGGLIVAIAGEYLPMRRYHGMGLAALAAGVKLHAYPDARVFYASEAYWAPLLALAQPRYLRAATLATPVWDSGLPGCVWHRLLVDLRLPPGTGVDVETRSAETPEDLQRADWRAEPPLLRSARGSELPWRDSGEAPAGTWEVLLQAAPGRYFQGRLTINGDGRQTPSLRALRVWYPRFSYSREYLPPVFRADAASAEFLDRLLALFEAEFTRWEDRIAAVQWLFDARTAPLETLAWLAGWLGLAFDPATDETRKRLLIRHAMSVHARRGTVPGLLLGATLAWERSVEEAWLRAPETLAERPHGLRLQEFFGLQAPLPAKVWRPADGRALLLAPQRLAEDPSLPDPAELAALGVSGAGAAASANPARRTQLQSALGFVPRAAVEEARLWAAWCDAAGSSPAARPGLPTDEPADPANWSDYLAKSLPCAPLRQRWQDFLARRWRRVSALNVAWGSRWRSFARIPSPIVLPASDAALGDWHRFEAQILRGLANAHRFRIVLPLPSGELDLDELVRRRASVLRVVERDKPAHTTAEVRFGFDLFRVGEARLGLDTRLETGLARRPELAALAYGSGAFDPAVLGRTDLGGARLSPTRPEPPVDRIGLDRG